MNLTDLQWRVLLALGDTLIPRDAFPSASEAGLRAFLERNSTAFGAQLTARLRAGIDALVALDFDTLPSERQRELVQRLESDDPSIAWPERSSRWLRTALALVSQGYYADATAGRTSWPMVGFDPAPETAAAAHRGCTVARLSRGRNTRRVRRDRRWRRRRWRRGCARAVAGRIRRAVDRPRRSAHACRGRPRSPAQPPVSRLWPQYRSARRDTRASSSDLAESARYSRTKRVIRTTR